MNKQKAEQLINKTKDDYNRIAPQFDSTRKYNWRDIGKVIESLDIKDGSSVLDLGCGGGRLYEILEKYNVSYLGIDNSEDLIKIAREKYINTKFEVSDITKINLKEKYDYVFSIAVLHHIPSKKLRRKTIFDIKNLLKKDGTAIVSVWYFWNQWKFVKEIIGQFFSLLRHSEQSEESKKIPARTYFGTGRLRFTQDDTRPRLPFGDFYKTWKNSKGEILAKRYHHAWTAHELKNFGFKIVSKDKNLIGIYKKT